MGATGGMGSIGGMGATGGMNAAGGSAGLNMFSQMFSGGSNLIGAGNASSLTVGKVLVSVGQQVAEGDVLY